MGPRSRTYLFSAALFVAAAGRADAAATGMLAEAAGYGAANRAQLADASPARTDGAAAQPAPCQPDDSQAAGSAGDAAGRSAAIPASPEQENPDLQRIWSGP